MRILKIAGQNIASLADAFVIDLTQDPLRSSGLFAITGPTGAGKSSILDAMCLALYGSAPRLTSGSRDDEVPDAGGEPIKAQDARAVLRRGTSQAWASVTFVGIDGQDYEARWSARRARDRADGRLQGVARQIARVSDGQVLASQSTHVAEQVQALTGLSYDEFRRTVLLAQGDFDAFLRADDKDRAALLEKVTGTGLYRAISTSVYDRTAEAQAAVTTLIQERDAHHMLSDEARANREAERRNLTAENDAARIARQALDADLAQHRRVIAAQARLQEAELALTASHAAFDAASDRRNQLAAIDRAEPLRLPYETLRQAEAARTHATHALAQATAALDHARTLRASRLDLAMAATARHDETEAVFKALGPLWTEATQLDSRIADAGREAARALHEAEQSDLRARSSKDRLKALTARMQTTEQALAEAAAAVDGVAQFAAISDDWERISQDFTDRGTSAQTEKSALDQSAMLTAQVAAGMAQLAGLEHADADDLTARQSVMDDAVTLTRTINELAASAPQERLNSLTKLTATLNDLEGARQAHAIAEQSLAISAHQKAQAQGEGQAARAATLTAEMALARAEAAVAALTAPTEQANLAASEAARALRLHLQPGQPCPVCGAADHAAQTDSVIARLATQLRQDLARAHADATEARRLMTQSAGDLAGATARVEQADRSLALQSEAAAAAMAYWRIAVPTARADPLCPDLPDQPSSSLRAELDLVEAARQDCLRVLAEIASLQARKDHNDAVRQTLSSALETRAVLRQDLTRSLAQTRQEAALAAQVGQGARDRGADLDARLLPVLALASEPRDALTRAPEALRLRLLGKVQLFRDAVARKAGLQADLTGLQPELAAARAGNDLAADQASHAAEEAQRRGLARMVLQEDREQLLGGEPTELHRTRHNQARLASQTAKEQATQALSEADAAVGLASGGHAAAVRTVAGADLAGTAARAALDHALRGSDLTEGELLPLFAVPRAEVEALRQGLRRLDDAVTAAVSSLAARQADLDEGMAAGLPEAGPEEVIAALTALEKGLSARAERIGALNTELAADEAIRLRLAGLQEQIMTAEATLAVWQAVNMAVGSRTGDAFARIAQSITLDQLVDHANHHLADLKPRYRLQRAAGLALQVLDLDMAAEARATRSLSGGERFLVSLALALALSRMGDKGGLAATLFIDEGFGSLDAETLDVAIDALETLQAQGRTIGVISHVDAMKDRIPVQIRVERQGGGKSRVRVTGPGG